MKKISIKTNGEQFYDITKDINEARAKEAIEDGIMVLFCPHTSCALTISENYDPLAKKDMEDFLKHVSPRDLSFIQHKIEGPDDSPAHMKSMILNQSLSLIIKDARVQLGKWQGIYLAEFRDQPKLREVWYSCLPSH